MRHRYLIAGVVAALVATGVPGPFLGTASAAAPRTESAWQGSFTLTTASGSVLIRAYDTGPGLAVLSLRRLIPGTHHAVAVRAGTCSSLGAVIVSVGTFTAGASGAISASVRLSAGQVAAIRSAATGTRRISLTLGSAARCATLRKSLSVTPQIWFAPLPPMPFHEWRPFIGSTDWPGLLAPNAAWTKAAGRITVYKIYGEWLGYASDAQLRQLVAALQARDIRIAIELAGLRSTTCGHGVEGFTDADPVAIAREAIDRVRRAGGAVSFVALDEPFAFASMYTGEGACRWTASRVAADVVAFTRALKRTHPSVVVGDIEPLWGSMTAADLERWLDAYRSAAAGALPFFHLDIDWTRADWAPVAHEVGAYARASGSRFGMIYNGGWWETSDAEWLGNAWSHVEAYELDASGPPDDAVFQSWTDHPDRVLPETSSAAFTHLVVDYARTRTALSITAAASGPDGAGPAGVSGTLRTVGGVAIAGKRVDLSATPLDGPYQVLRLEGRVPTAATTAVVGIRVNIEGAGPNAADLAVYLPEYTDGTSAANRVPDPTFAEGLRRWGVDGTARATLVTSDQGPGSMLHVTATASQGLMVNSSEFAVVPGSAYRFAIGVRVPEASAGSAYAAVIFLGGTESRRDRLALAPAPMPLGTAPTNAAGSYALPLGRLEAGRYALRARYPGDSLRWPATGTTTVAVP